MVSEQALGLTTSASLSFLVLPLYRRLFLFAMSTSAATSSTAASSILSFPSVHNQLTLKLTASNYLLWKTQFLPILHGYQLFNHVDGTKPPSKEVAGAPNPEYQTWYLQDQLVLSWILGLLSESVLSQVVGTTSAYDAWSRL